jgi:hypothetical protein
LTPRGSDFGRHRGQEASEPDRYCSTRDTAAWWRALADECKDNAKDKNGKPLAGAALASHLKKCRHDVCDMKAVAEKAGKRLSGAAYNSFMKKCENDAGRVVVLEIGAKNASACGRAFQVVRNGLIADAKQQSSPQTAMCHFLP